MRRHTLDAIANDDSVPVMVPRNVKTLVQTPPERVRRLRRHLLAVLSTSPTSGEFEHPASPARPEPDGFTARVARAACAMCEGWCCKNGADDGFLDERTVARVRHARETLAARAVLRLYVERVRRRRTRGRASFMGNKVARWTGRYGRMCATATSVGAPWLHGKRRCATPVTIIAGEGGKMRTSPVLTP